ncbi:MAG: ABC transporter ATP-binding protein [Candidatus Heimdallarchaeota archaeon]|nr:ABC transporter ATP-binding protein [Candidatus Heimdallarchaeota archaeon]
MSNKAISLNRITFKYKNCDEFALKNVSFDINEGDFLLLVGYSGSGKSTLLKTINGLIPHFYSGTFGGAITLFGEDISETTTAQLAQKVGFVFQNPENQLSNLTVEREIAFPMENFGIPREEIRNRVEEIIELFNLEKIRNQSPFNISGGEQQLTAIAAAFVLDPKILILDEVTAHLSPKMANIILNKLTELNNKYHKTIILSEHRLDRCLKYINKIAYLEKGILKVFGSTREVLLNKNYPIEMLPKIPNFYLRLVEDIEMLETVSEKYKNQFKQNELPLSVDDFIDIIKGGK